MMSHDQQPPADYSPELTEDKHRFLADVATLYYDENLTQSEIAERLGISRSSISRLLKEARDLGVVQIAINRPADNSAQLSNALKTALDVAEVYVVPAGMRGYSQVVEALGVVAANILQQKLRDNSILGISWSTGVYQAVRALQNASAMNVTVAQLTGSVVNANPLLDSPDLERWLAQTLGARYVYLPAPLMVSDEHIRDALLADKMIAERLKIARQADVALVGIGAAFPPLSSLLQMGYITEDDLREATRLGGVGDILSTFFDLEGQPIDLALHKRIIGVSLDDLKNIRHVIGVAASREKAKAIIGALRGRYINCLVTDDQAATAILKLI
jgi:deoxyribonucleoside regulator